MSDIDVAAIYTHAAQIPEITSFYVFFRNLIPILGELEFYESHEWDERSHVRSQPEVILLDYIKKWASEKLKLRESTFAYHKYKSNRTLRYLEKQLGARSQHFLDGDTALNKFLPHFAHQIVQAVQARHHENFHPVINLEIGLLNESPELSKGPGLYFNELGSLILFLSIIPDSELYFPDFELELTSLRKKEPIKTWFKTIVSSEILITQTSLRAQRGNSAENQNWLNKLHQFRVLH